MFKISIIVSTYNAAPFIERCLKSLFEQTLDGIEYIIINDASTDNTLDIIKQTIDQYPSKKSNISLINHAENKGLAYSRSEGLHLAKGEYVIHCDGDDWVDNDYYEKLLNLAEKNNANIVAGNYKIEFLDKQLIWCFPKIDSAMQFLELPKWEFLSIWSHLIRRSFIEDNKLEYPQHYDYGCDDAFLFKCYCISKNGNYVFSGPSYYHYNKENIESMTLKKYTVYYLDQKENIFRMLSDFVISLGKDPSKNRLISDEKRIIKEGYLLTDKPEFKKWRNAFPEINSIVYQDANLSKLYKLAWYMGHVMDPFFMKMYMAISHSFKR